MTHTQNMEPKAPGELRERLEDTVSAAILAERGPQALDDAPRRPVRWFWVAAPALALACLTVVLAVRQPRLSPYDTFSDPALAYAALEQAFSAFSEPVGAGFNAINVSLEAFDQTLESARTPQQL